MNAREVTKKNRKRRNFGPVQTTKQTVKEREAVGFPNPSSHSFRSSPFSFLSHSDMFTFYLPPRCFFSFTFATLLSSTFLNHLRPSRPLFSQFIAFQYRALLNSFSRTHSLERRTSRTSTATPPPLTTPPPPNNNNPGNKIIASATYTYTQIHTPRLSPFNNCTSP